MKNRAETSARSTTHTRSTTSATRTTRALQIALLVVATAFIIYGAARGEVRTVLIKAINICLECIGLG